MGLDQLPDDLLRIVVERLPYTATFRARRVSRRVRALVHAALGGATTPTLGDWIARDHPGIAYDEVCGR